MGAREKANNMKLLKLLLPIILSVSLYGESIEELWMSSPQHAKYIQAKENNNRELAMKIKYTEIRKLKTSVLHDYIKDFKDKFEERMLERHYQFPTQLCDLLASIHKEGRALLKNPSEKVKHTFAKSLFDFMYHYNNEDGRAQKYALKIAKKTPELKGASFLKVLEKMGKDSDTEAAKTPEQKQKEYETERNRKKSIKLSKYLGIPYKKERSLKEYKALMLIKLKELEILIKNEKIKSVYIHENFNSAKKRISIGTFYTLFLAMHDIIQAREKEKQAKWNEIIEQLKGLGNN